MTVLMKTTRSKVLRVPKPPEESETREALPAALEGSVGKLAEQIESLTQQLEAMKTEIQTVAAKRYPETIRLQAVHGVDRSRL